ncbi:MAG: peptidylprolyl isomerase [Pirellulales bacterium]|nr:peptidylprolyl isomerase [Pirellulales bacterium]
MRTMNLGQTNQCWRTTGLAILILAVLGGCGGKDDAAKNTPTNEDGASRPWSDDLGGKKKRKDAPALPPVVALVTSLGEIRVELDPKNVPLTVDNFLHYVDEGYYSGTIFHRVDKGSAVLGGAYTPDLAEKPPTRFAVRNEADKGLKNTRGTIAMARQPDVIDSATSQFFFNLADNAMLDHKDKTAEGYGYCVFGRVTDGMDVLDKLSGVAVRDIANPNPSNPNAAPMAGVPVETVLIKEIRRVR